MSQTVARDEWVVHGLGSEDGWRSAHKADYECEMCQIMREVAYTMTFGPIHITKVRI